MFGLFKKKNQDNPPQAKPKKSGYYLELDETNSPAVKPTEEAAKAVAPVTEEKPTPVVAPSVPEPVQNGKQPVVEEKKPEETKKPGKKSAKLKAKTPKVEKTPAAKKEEPVAVEAPVGTFAPQYLNPAYALNQSRRRPGANMTSFLDMARQIKG